MGFIGKLAVFRERKKEEGFTLLELMIVIGVIGILSLMAIPSFMHQREAAAASSVKADLRNAGMNMEQSLISNKNKYPSYIPNYSQQSKGTKLDLDMKTSNAQKFCILGTHSDYPDIKFSYDSSMGGILPKSQSCIIPSAGNWALEMKDKKALIIYAYNDALKDMWTGYLTDAGFGTVTYKYNPPVTEYKDHDIIVVASSYWMVPYAVGVNVRAGYNLGNSVMVEGNDNGSNNINSIVEESHAAAVMGQVDMNKTRLPVRPDFPYTFDGVAFNNDSGWACVTKVVPDAIPTTTSLKPKNPAVTCITSAVRSDTNTGGRLVYATYLSDGKNQSFINSATQWMLNK